MSLSLPTYTILIKSADYLCDYDGMNYYAALELKFDRPILPNEILVKETLNFTAKIQTIIHELVEVEIMRKLKINYWKAHRHAFNSEIHPNNLKEIIEIYKGRLS